MHSPCLSGFVCFPYFVGGFVRFLGHTQLVQGLFPVGAEGKCVELGIKPRSSPGKNLFLSLELSASPAHLLTSLGQPLPAVLKRPWGARHQPRTPGGSTHKANTLVLLSTFLVVRILLFMWSGVTHLSVLRDYSWQVQGVHGVPGIKPSWSGKRQTSYPLY